MAAAENTPSRVDRRTNIVTEALSPDGLLYKIAHSAIQSTEEELTPLDVGYVFLPPRNPGDAYHARWELVDSARDAIRSAAEAEKDSVMALADGLDMRRVESVTDEDDLDKIHTDKAIWVIEGGANKTSVVRRAIALYAMSQMFRAESQLLQQELFQFGSERPIPRQKNGKANPEYGVAQEIAEDSLPEGDTLNEFLLNVYSAFQSGYGSLDPISPTPYNLGKSIKYQARLRGRKTPTLHEIMPHPLDGGLMDGFEAISRSDKAQPNGAQLVIATNGHYRPKGELQATQWADKHGYGMLPPVAMGDEAGFIASHDGSEYTTGARNVMAYVNEMVILHRLAKG